MRYSATNTVPRDFYILDIIHISPKAARQTDCVMIILITSEPYLLLFKPEINLIFIILQTVYPLSVMPLKGKSSFSNRKKSPRFRKIKKAPTVQYSPTIATLSTVSVAKTKAQNARFTSQSKHFQEKPLHLPYA